MCVPPEFWIILVALEDWFFDASSTSLVWKLIKRMPCDGAWVNTTVGSVKWLFRGGKTVSDFPFQIA
jgi:hypothetical protein